MGIEREQQIRKNGQREREREHAYVKGLVERNNKKIEKIDYLNKIMQNRWTDVEDFDKWVCKIEKVGFQCKIDRKFQPN